MKMDFIHIGYHKTASTFLQSRVFPTIENLVVVNHQNRMADEWFYDRFVSVDAHTFDAPTFQNDLLNMMSTRADTSSADRTIYAISEENLSGDIYTGMESRELMLRLHEVFGTTKVLIVIRNQIDFILSAYSNYILHGGTSGISQWLWGQETRFGRIQGKVMYSSLIRDYINLFGQDQVFVIQYEKLFNQSEGIGSFLSTFGLTLPDVQTKRVNPGRSLRGNAFLALLNRAGLDQLRGREAVARLFSGRGRDRAYVKALLGEKMGEIRADNRRLEGIVGASLVSEYYE